MSAAVAISPTSGNITNKVSATEITASGITNNDPTTGAQDTYYFKASAAGHDSLKSPVWAPSEAGAAEWHNVIFPAAATWTLGVYKTADDTSVVTASVVVN